MGKVQIVYLGKEQSRKGQTSGLLKIGKLKNILLYYEQRPDRGAGASSL